MGFLGPLPTRELGPLRRTKYQLSPLTPSTFMKHVGLTEAYAVVSSLSLKLKGGNSPFLFKFLSNYLKESGLKKIIWDTYVSSLAFRNLSGHHLHFLGLQ